MRTRPGHYACLIALALPFLLLAQSPEIATKDAPVTFKSTSNLIPVPVVVRDGKGKTIGNLTVEDFQLFDNGKPQAISKFTLETTAIAPDQPVSTPRSQTIKSPAATPTPTTPAPQSMPDRFVAYLFDDLHMTLQGLVSTRDAAIRQIASAQHANERAAIYTTSGRQAQEFTSDSDRLRSVLTAISAGPAAAAKSLAQNSCPAVDYYMGDRIYNKDEIAVLKIAVKDALICLNLPYNKNIEISDADIRICEGLHPQRPVCTAVEVSKRAARQAVEFGSRDTESSLNVLRAVVTRMTSMPGQRNIVLVSPGFLVLDDRHEEEMGLIDRAIRANVVIGGLDARGLNTSLPGGDASARVINAETNKDKIPFTNMESIVQTDVIATLADGTGGTFYQGTNDYDEGFARVAATPEFKYVLGFSPQDLKLDGRLHTLKVTLRNGKGLDLQFRKGYYAASYAAGPEGKAKQAIEEAFFSRDEIHGLPAVLQTQYFKLDNGDATLSAVTRIDVRKLSFRKDAGRNFNDVTVVTGLFDNDGNYISGAQKILQMSLLDQTLQNDKRLAPGISVEHSFPVHPGRYTVRVVVRDSEGQLLSAQSNLVEIPQ